MEICDIPVLILAGGKGTRIKHLLNDIPKPMYPVFQKPFLEYQLSYLKKFGFQKFIISVGYKAEVIEDYYKSQINISFVKETEPLGTGGGIMAALPDIATDNFLVLNGDTLFLMDYSGFINFSKFNPDKSLIALKKTDRLLGYGLVKMDENNQILNFSEKANAKNDHTGLINAGVYLLNKKQLQSIGVPKISSVELDIFPLLVDLGLFGYEARAEFIDIGTPETLYQIEDFVKAHRLSIV